MTGRHAIWRGLLVSVRNAAEAVEAVAGGAAIVDVKEPTRGPLGQAGPDAVVEIAAAIDDAVPWTLACGELHAGADSVVEFLHRVRDRLPRGSAGPAACKAGPAALGIDEWRRCYAAVRAAVPRGIEPVAVAYADWRRAAAPAPDEIIAAAAAEGAETLLLDTFDKSGPGLLGSDTGPALGAWFDQARACGLTVAVAGRLTLAEIGSVAGLGPDVVAVRSAVCVGGRLGTVVCPLVAEAVRAVRSPAGVGTPPRGRLPGRVTVSGPRLDTMQGSVSDVAAAHLPSGANGMASDRPGEIS